ncbi:hypothetical protein EJB05_48719, partial [Eragrostis curvula]
MPTRYFRGGIRKFSGLPGGVRVEGMVLLQLYFRGWELLPSEAAADLKLLARAERSWAVAKLEKNSSELQANFKLLCSFAPGRGCFMCAGRYDIDHPFMNPLAMPTEEWAVLGCRRALVTVAELDTMRNRGRRYVEALRGRAWPGEGAVLYETRGEGHVYFIDKLVRQPYCKSAATMFTVIS